MDRTASARSRRSSRQRAPPPGDARAAWSVRRCCSLPFSGSVGPRAAGPVQFQPMLIRTNSRTMHGSRRRSAPRWRPSCVWAAGSQPGRCLRPRVLPGWTRDLAPALAGFGRSSPAAKRALAAPAQLAAPAPGIDERRREAPHAGPMLCRRHRRGGNRPEHRRRSYPHPVGLPPPAGKSRGAWTGRAVVRQGRARPASAGSPFRTSLTLWQQAMLCDCHRTVSAGAEKNAGCGIHPQLASSKVRPAGGIRQKLQMLGFRQRRLTKRMAPRMPTPQEDRPTGSPPSPISRPSARLS